MKVIDWILTRDSGRKTMSLNRVRSSEAAQLQRFER